MKTMLKSASKTFSEKDANGTLKNAFRHRWLLKTLALISIALVLCIQFDVGKSLAKDVDDIKDAEERLLLDLRPFTSPLAKLIALNSDRRLTVIHYLPSRLLVTATYERTLSDEEAVRISSRLQERELQDALRSKRFAGKALAAGDQFHLLLAENGHVKGEAWGFVDDAPWALRSFINDVLEQIKQQERFVQVELADAYLRSAGIAQERGNELEKSDRFRFVAIEDFPAEVQPIMIHAIHAPLNFHPLKKDQYELLLKYRSHGNELFVTTAGGQSLFQLSLYSTK